MTRHIGYSGVALEPILPAVFEGMDIRGITKWHELSGRLFFLVDGASKDILVYDGVDGRIIGSQSYLTGHEGSSSCFCGGLAFEDGGDKLYVSVICPPYGYIYVFHTSYIAVQHRVDMRLIHRMWIPICSEELVVGIHNLPTSVRTLADIKGAHIGELSVFDVNLTGYGLTISGGMIYVVTRRSVTCKDIEEREFSLPLSLLTILNSESGVCRGHCILGVGSITQSSVEWSTSFTEESVYDKVCHGVGVFDRGLVLGLASDGTLTTVIDTMDGRVVGPIRHTRGARQLATLRFDALDSALFVGPELPTPIVFPTFDTATLISELVFDVALPSDFHIDQDSWKFYAACGNKILVFDLLPYILNVQYPKGYAIGHVVDFHDLIELDKTYVMKGFFRNTTEDTLTGVELEVKDDRTAIFSAVYLSLDAGVTVAKRIDLGDVLKLGSALFYVCIDTTGLTRQEYHELATSYNFFRIPLIATLGMSRD